MRSSEAASAVLGLKIRPSPALSTTRERKGRPGREPRGPGASEHNLTPCAGSNDRKSWTTMALARSRQISRTAQNRRTNFQQNRGPARGSSNRQQPTPPYRDSLRRMMVDQSQKLVSDNAE